MEVIPLIIENYRYALIAYGYYSAAKSGVNAITTGKWFYDTTKGIYRLVVPKKEKWEMIENCRIIDPKEIDTFIIHDNKENDFSLIYKLSYSEK